MILEWIRRILSRLRPQHSNYEAKTNENVVDAAVRNYDLRARLSIPRYDCSGDPPPLQWKPCHVSTINRFKAEMTCPYGHGLTLKGHSVAADGTVSPSVVCPMQGCNFHRFVTLVAWTFGNVPR